MNLQSTVEKILPICKSCNALEGLHGGVLAEHDLRAVRGGGGESADGRGGGPVLPGEGSKELNPP